MGVTELVLSNPEFLAGHVVAMVTYCATKLTETCSPMTIQKQNMTSWGMCLKRRPKNEDRRPKTLWSKTKTHWSKTKTHRSKTKTH